MENKYETTPIIEIRDDIDHRKECDCCESKEKLKRVVTGNLFVKTERTRSVVLCDKCRAELGSLMSLDLAIQVKAKNQALKEILELVPEEHSDKVDEIFSKN